MVKLVDTLALGASAARHESSSLSLPTNIINKKFLYYLCRAAGAYQ